MNINTQIPPPPPSSVFHAELQSSSESETTIEILPEQSTSLSERKITKCSPDRHLLSTFLPLMGITLSIIGIEASHQYHYIPLKELSYVVLIPSLILITIYQVMLKAVFKNPSPSP